MSVMLYRVLAASGGFVNGAEVPIGSEVSLSLAEARYEVDAGNVAPTGREPVLPIVPVLLPSDLLPSLRGATGRTVPVQSLENFLIRDDGTIALALQARGDEIAVYVTEQMAQQLAASRAEFVAAVREALNGKEF